MKASSCLFGLVWLFFSVLVSAQPVRRAVLAQPVQPVPVRAEYKHLRITKLPMDRGVVDAKIMLLGAVDASPEVLSSLSPAQKSMVAKVVNRVKMNDPLGAREVWKEFVISTEADTAPLDIMELLFYVFRESILEMNEEISWFLEKLANMNAIADAITEYLKNLTDENITLESDWNTDPQCNLKTIRDCIEKERDETETKAEAALQRRPHVTSTVSNVSKILHDTAMAVIRKAG